MSSKETSNPVDYLWTPDRKKNKLWSRGKLKVHYEEHGILEFKAKSSKEYSNMVHEFGTIKSDSILLSIEGSYVYRYDPSINNIFVVTLKGGIIKSFYKWDGRPDDRIIGVLKRFGKL